MSDHIDAPPFTENRSPDLKVQLMFHFDPDLKSNGATCSVATETPRHLRTYIVPKIAAWSARECLWRSGDVDPGQV